MTDDTLKPLHPDTEATPEKKRRRFSPVWMFPLIAIAIGLGLLWKDYSERGPLITINFPNASGLKAGETSLRYRDVQVGKLETLTFSDDLSEVLGEFRIDKDVAHYIDSDAQFWIVKPEISLRGVSGLDTVLTGPYIEGEWDNKAGEKQREFKIRPTAPLTRLDARGTKVTLRSNDGGALEVGAPVFYRQVEVGRIQSKRLTNDGTGVEFDIFVDAPNDARLTEGTRFWVVAGVDISIGAEGARFSIGSLSSLLEGGVAFRDFSPGIGDKVEEGHVYSLYANARDATSEQLQADPGQQLVIDLYFGRSVRGLTVGAPVEYEGIRVGRVLEIAAEVDPVSGEFATRTSVGVAPTFLGLEENDVAGARDFVNRAVKRGLRAQLTQGSLLTGALIVRMVDSPESPPEELTDNGKGRVRMPTVPSDLDELAGSVQGALRRVEKLPFEEIFGNILVLLENANKVVGSDGVREAPAKLASALDALASLLNSDGVRAAPAEVSAFLTRLNVILASDTIDQARDDAAATLANARQVMAALAASGLVNEASGAVAALRERLNDPALAALAGKAGDTADSVTALLNDPSLKAAPERAVAAIDSLQALLTSPGVTEVPGEAAELLASLRATVNSPEVKSTLADAAATMASAKAVAGRIEETDAAGEASAAIASLRARLDDPALAALAGKVGQTTDAATALLNEPALKAAPARAVAAIDSLQALLTSPGVTEVPGEAAELLASLRATVNSPEVKSTLTDAAATMASARAVTGRIQETDAAGEASAAIAALRARLDDPELARMISSFADAGSSASAFLASDDLQKTPGAVNEALTSVNAILQDPALRDSPKELQGALISARATLDQIAAADVGGKIAGAATSAANLMDDPALRTFAENAGGAADALRQVLSSPGADQLPAAATKALNSTAELFDRIDEARLASVTAKTLASIGNAADRVPALISEITTLARRADAMLASLDAGSEFNYEMVSAIREIRDAARSVSDLADMIEREPNAFILGK